MIYGYARVSTDGQSVDAQVKQLRDAGADKVFRETASGARSDRAQLRRALDQLGKGDALMVTRLDRLARSFRGREAPILGPVKDLSVSAEIWTRPIFL
jgi:DNA invertase Pin-like site-specific DNA recombinase